MRPEGNASGEWVMRVVAKQPIALGEEVCFSYGERSNDDLFVHYGFVPLRNPRDDVLLWESVTAAVEWYHAQSGMPKGAVFVEDDGMVPRLQALGMALLASVLLRCHADGVRRHVVRTHCSGTFLLQWATLHGCSAAEALMDDDSEE